MKKQELEPKAQKHINNKDAVKVVRDLEGDDLGVFGFLLDSSPTFLFIQIVSDFEFDGYSIIPERTVSNIRCNKTDRFHKSILRKEGIFDNNYGFSSQLDLTSWPSVFKSLKANNFIVTLEDEAAEETDFLIGRIVRVNKKSVSIQYFNALGQLDSETTKMDYEDITILSFDNRYINMYSKYLKEPNKKT